MGRGRADWGRSNLELWLKALGLKEEISQTSPGPSSSRSKEDEGMVGSGWMNRMSCLETNVREQPMVSM